MVQRGLAGNTARTEVMEHVFKNEEKRQLGKHSLPRRERNLPGFHANRFGDWVEEEDLEECRHGQQPLG